jgi:hypothetical protein
VIISKRMPTIYVSGLLLCLSFSAYAQLPAGQASAEIRRTAFGLGCLPHHSPATLIRPMAMTSPGFFRQAVGRVAIHRGADRKDPEYRVQVIKEGRR